MRFVEAEGAILARLAGCVAALEARVRTAAAAAPARGGGGGGARDAGSPATRSLRAPSADELAEALARMAPFAPFGGRGRGGVGAAPQSPPPAAGGRGVYDRQLRAARRVELLQRLWYAGRVRASRVERAGDNADVAVLLPPSLRGGGRVVRSDVAAALAGRAATNLQPFAAPPPPPSSAAGSGLPPAAGLRAGWVGGLEQAAERGAPAVPPAGTSYRAPAPATDPAARVLVQAKPRPPVLPQLPPDTERVGGDRVAAAGGGGGGRGGGAGLRHAPAAPAGGAPSALFAALATAPPGGAGADAHSAAAPEAAAESTPPPAPPQPPSLSRRVSVFGEAAAREFPAALGGLAAAGAAEPAAAPAADSGKAAVGARDSVLTPPRGPAAAAGFAAPARSSIFGSAPAAGAPGASGGGGGGSGVATVAPSEEDHIAGLSAFYAAVEPAKVGGVREMYTKHGAGIWKKLDQKYGGKASAYAPGSPAPGSAAPPAGAALTPSATVAWGAGSPAVGGGGGSFGSPAFGTPPRAAARAAFGSDTGAGGLGAGARPAFGAPAFGASAVGGGAVGMAAALRGAAAAPAVAGGGGGFAPGLPEHHLARLRAYYEKHNPAKAANVAKAFATHGAGVWAQLEQKYPGTTAEFTAGLMLPSAAGAGAPPSGGFGAAAAAGGGGVFGRAASAAVPVFGQPAAGGLGPRPFGPGASFTQYRG